MNRIFDQDSSVMGFLSRITDLILLNFMWLIGCIPIVTIGTSTAALYYCVEKLRENDDVSMFKNFLNAYRFNFKQATILFGVILVALCVIAADVFVLYQTEIEVNTVILVIIGVFSLVILMAVGYVLPLQSCFSNTVKQTIKNAWLLSILHLPKSFLVAVLNCLPVLLWLFLPNVFNRCLGLMLFLGGSGIAYLNNMILQKIFIRYYDRNEELPC